MKLSHRFYTSNMLKFKIWQLLWREYVRLYPDSVVDCFEIMCDFKTIQNLKLGQPMILLWQCSKGSTDLDPWPKDELVLDGLTSTRNHSYKLTIGLEETTLEKLD